MNQPNAKHTATPWYLHKHEDGKGRQLIHGNLLIPVAILESENKSNAEFIVKCCNSHDQLVEALEDVRLVLNSVMKFSNGDDLVDLHDEAFYAIKKIQQALKLAKGK